MEALTLSKRGRKPTPDEKKFSNVARVYFTDEEWTALERARGNKPRSQYFRDLFLADLEAREKAALKLQAIMNFAQQGDTPA